MFNLDKHLDIDGEVRCLRRAINEITALAGGPPDNEYKNFGTKNFCDPGWG